MDVTIENPAWEAMSRKEKNDRLMLEQMAMLALFLERGAITQAEYDRSLSGLRQGGLT